MYVNQIHINTYDNYIFQNIFQGESLRKIGVCMRCTCRYLFIHKHKQMTGKRIIFCTIPIKISFQYSDDDKHSLSHLY